jgi:site-specific recombinase XerD
MNMTDSIIDFRRFLKRRNFSSHTIKNYLNSIKQFVLWLDTPIEEVTCDKVFEYMGYLIDKRLSPQTINSNLYRIRAFYNFLHFDKELPIEVPFKKTSRLKPPKPLPQFLRDEDVEKFFSVVKKSRDMAMFKVMLRCGLRVEEVSKLTIKAIDLKQKRLLVIRGKGKKDRMTYISEDAQNALSRYLKQRSSSRVEKVFLVEKGTYKGKPISVRGIQKRMEYYARKAGVKASCHRMRHTMATQMLNADADIVTIQELLGHTKISTTERYSKVSNVKVRRDYYHAMRIITNGRSRGTRGKGYKKFFTKEKLRMVMNDFEEPA